MRFRITVFESNSEYTNLGPECEECHQRVSRGTQVTKCILSDQPRRQGVIVGEYGRVYACVDSTNLVKSKRIFIGLLKLIHSLIPHLANIRRQVSKSARRDSEKLLHNLRTQNAHGMQELFALLPQAELAGNYTNQVETTRRIIEDDTDQAARVLLRLLKINNQMKCEIDSFEMLSEEVARVKKKSHPIRSVILNSLHHFFSDFTDKRVIVNVEEYAGRADLQYDLFSVVLYHLFGNAAKYTIGHSSMNIYFSSTNSTNVIQIEMTSLAISDEDLPRLFEERFSSEAAKRLKLAGDGLGMYMVKRCLAYHGGDLIIDRNVDPDQRITSGREAYERNVFSIVLPR